MSDRENPANRTAVTHTIIQHHSLDVHAHLHLHFPAGEKPSFEEAATSGHSFMVEHEVTAEVPQGCLHSFESIPGSMAFGDRSLGTCTQIHCMGLSAHVDGELLGPKQLDNVR